MKDRENYAVIMKDITKTFGNFTALKDNKLYVEKGTIHSILGENGAGKSTLMNILYGLYQADQGEIYINGELKDIKTPSDAIENGIGMVHQHFMLVHNFTVTQNILLGKEVTKGRGFLDLKGGRKEVEKLIDRYGLYVDPDAKIEDISVGMQQRVEILKALYRGADILILDEPTAVLTPQEIDELIKIMHNLIEDGKTIIIITHKLDEIKKSADKCTIIRRGQYIDTVDVNDVSKSDLANMMVGHAVNLKVDKEEASVGQVIFEIKDLIVKDERNIETVKGLNLSVKKGEIYGIAGIDGNGQKELVEAITNLTKVESGTIKINDKEIQNTTPHESIISGVSTIHEDRLKRGLVPDFTVAENVIIEKFYKKPYSVKGRINNEAVLSHTRDLIKEYDIRPENCEKNLARGLSGGNQQKVIIAREVANDPDILVAVQPTRGLDVGAIEYVHKSLINQRDKGKAILLISFELDEIMNVADTIGVIYDGNIQGEYKQGSVSEKEIGLLMAGGDINEGK